VQPLSDFWSACTQLRSQLTFLRIKYPLDVEAVPVDGAPASLRATATVLFPSIKSKALISYIFDWDTYSRWPLAIDGVKCDVKVAYGSAEYVDPFISRKPAANWSNSREKILNAVLDRLSQATPSENHGCLLDACIEGAEQFA
jgi:hypothetical protein